jgi:IclR family KDG regulon transcriptional repressor
MAYKIGAVDRALSLLEVLAEHPGLGVTEIAQLTGNTKSLVFRLIYTLEQRGYVIKDPASRTYTLGYRPLYLAAHAQEQLSLIHIANPFVDALAERSGENVVLLVRDGTASVCLAVRRSPHQGQIYAQVGRRGPLHVGGGPKVLLAFAPDEVREAVLTAPLPRYTERTVTDPAQLEALLANIRRTGVNESHGDLDRDAFSFAAAVYGRSGEVVAALSVAGLASRLDDGRAETYRRLARDTARRLSEALGWRPKLVASV